MAEQRSLNPRKAAVLRAVVEEYVRSGEPVGSETIAERHRLGVSSATIRNEMAALEEMGFLMHPHTSAGRIPTDLGYRSYVDSLPARERLRDTQRRAIGDFFTQAVGDLEGVLRGATQLLSRLTQYAGLAVPPSQPDERLLRVELVEMGTKILILAITQHGQVATRMIERPEGLEPNAVEENQHRVSDVANEATIGATATRVKQMARDASPVEGGLLSMISEALVDMEARTPAEHVLVGGVGNLASELALWRVETMRRLFDALEQEAEVLRLLRDASGQEELSVTIGHEDPATRQWEASVVAAPFRAGETTLGTIGVVGPTRMDYPTTISAVRAVARRLTELAEQLDE
ncbi:MAG: heat-inducible transcriptional repressor HrcA [Actinomycetota bacterium]